MALLFKRISIITLILILLSVTLIPPKRSDAFALPLIGAVPAAAAAFWGGAILVAAVGGAVGMDDDVQESIKDFGKAAWDGATDAIKASMSWTTSKIQASTPTETNTKTYEIKWEPEVRTYLEHKWTEHFSYDPAKPSLAMGLSGTGLLTYTSDLQTYGGVKADSGYLYAIKKDYFSVGSYRYLYEISYFAAQNLWFAHTQSNVGGGTYRITTFPEIYSQYTDVVSLVNQLLADGVLMTYVVPEDAASVDTTPVYTSPIPYAGDVVAPAFPANVPDVYTMPAPYVIPTADPDVVDLAMPTIGFPAGIRTGNPADVAIANPALPDIGVTDLTPDQAISRPADVQSPSADTGPIGIGNILSWLNGFWDKLIDILKSLFIPTAINVGVIGNVWADRFPAIDNIISGLRSLTALDYDQTPPKFEFVINGKKYTFINLAAIPSSWISLARSFIRITVWFSFIFMVLREWRPRPHVG